MWNFYFFQRCCQKKKMPFFLTVLLKVNSNLQLPKKQSSLAASRFLFIRSETFSDPHCSISFVNISFYLFIFVCSPTNHPLIYSPSAGLFFSNSVEDFLTKLSLFVACAPDPAPRDIPSSRRFPGELQRQRAGRPRAQQHGQHQPTSSPQLPPGGVLRTNITQQPHRGRWKLRPRIQ